MNSLLVALLSFILVLLVRPATVLAVPSEGDGQAIFREVLGRDDGFADVSADVTMTIRAADGRETVREMRIQMLELPEDGEKRLFVFNNPRDIRGTAVLSHTLPDAESQWIYLPAFKRIKRISTSNRSGPFVSSEFSYEDIASVLMSKYRYKLRGEARVDEHDCFVVEMRPEYASSGYSYQLAYVDRAEYIVRKMEYFDRQAKQVKTLKLGDYKKYHDKFWRPLNLNMHNHRTGRKTQMQWRNVKYQQGLNGRDFAKQALKRVR